MTAAPRRVLMVSWEYPPVILGGLARHVDRLGAALAAGGMEVHVLTRGAPGDPASEERAGVHVHRVEAAPMPYDLDAFLSWVAALDGALRGAAPRLPARFDVVHGHDWLVARAAAGLADALGAPFVATVHATEHGRHAGRVDRHPQSHIHAIERRMARRARRVIVCSQFMRGHVTKAFGVDPARVDVVANGVDPHPPTPPRSELDALRATLAAPGEPLVLLAGRLVHEKGFHVALDALALVRGRVPRVAIAGAGPQEALLRARARSLGLDGRVAFLGWADDARLQGLYRVADLCVVPSLFEPFGLVALEAMAAGCPCAVADRGGLREVVPAGAGLRFPAGDAAALAAAIERAIADPALRARMARAGRARAARMRWEDAARATRAAYARCRP